MVGRTEGLCKGEALVEGDREDTGERLQLPVGVPAPCRPLGVVETDAIVEAVGSSWVLVTFAVGDGEPHALGDHSVVADKLEQTVLLGVWQLVLEALGEGS